MPPNTPIFILGLAVGTTLLVVGLLLGFWFGRKTVPGYSLVERDQFLGFLGNLSTWTSEFAIDVSKYQTQLDSLTKRVQSDESAPKEEILQLLTEIMHSNHQLQNRLDTAEHRLEMQTHQIANYLNEARTDALTGLFNRRAFDKLSDELNSNWQINEQRFSLGLIDIDHFKKINDNYGHPAGDAVLTHVAGILQAELGDSVCVARYGGEEFAVLSLASATETAEALDRLRSLVSKTEVTHENKVITTTLSAGTAEIQADEKFGRLVRRADEALYAAKLGGRDRVYLHDGTVCKLVTRIAKTVNNTSMTESDSNALLVEIRGPSEVQSRVQKRLQRIIEEETRRIVGS